MTTPQIFAGTMGSSSGVDIGDNTPNSLLLDSSLSQYLSRTPSAVGDRTKWTYSGWVKNASVSTLQAILQAYTSSTNTSFLQFQADGTIRFLNYLASAASGTLITNRVFRDPTAWIHICFIYDTTAATSTDRLQLWINGVRETSFSSYSAPALNTGAGLINATVAHSIGGSTAGVGTADYYAALATLVDGQALAPTAFGRFSPDTGEWVPKNYAGTYGTNGFKLEFLNGTALGTDTSGNGNDWTVNGGITSANQYSDTPTNNYCVLNALFRNSTLISKGNLDFYNAPTGWKSTLGTSALPEDKVYFEGTAQLVGGANSGVFVGLSTAGATQDTTNPANTWSLGATGGAVQIHNSGAVVGVSGATAASDVLSVAYDKTTGKLWCRQNNNAWLDSVGGATGNPATGVNPTMTLTPGTEVFPYTTCYANGVRFNFGATTFAYTPPTGFKALCTANLPTPAIIKPKEHFDVALDGGATIKATAEAVFPSNFFEWIKDRSAVNNHQLIDTVRGATAVLQSNTTAAETTYATPAGSSVGWAWKMGGAAVTNNAGTIASQVSANAEAGQSTVSYLSNGVAGSTVGHGLNDPPGLIITKQRNGGNDWWCYHSGLPSSAYAVKLNGTDAQNNTVNFWNNTAPDSGRFTIGYWAGNINATPGDNIAYCFAEIPGFSKIGSVVMNSSADGQHVYCGFKPAYLLAKRTDSTSDWFVKDSVRSPYNVATQAIKPNSSAAEVTTGFDVDFTATGFKVRTALAGTYIFYAIADIPAKYSRAR